MTINNNTIETLSALFSLLYYETFFILWVNKGFTFNS